MFKRLARSRYGQEALGFLLASYLWFVQRTSSFVSEPADLEPVFRRETPAIGAMWHGQHLMLSFSWPRAIARVAALISRSGDGGLQAAALRRLGVIPVRGSGGRSGRVQRKGGAPALRGLLRALEDGTSVAMTADVAKVARVAGLGIVTVARLSGRPILPMAVVAKRRIDFKSWDRASIGLPFNRCAIVIGDPIRVPRDADDDAMETARRQVEEGLDAVHARAYAMVDSRDPGADLRRR
jgi:hypothetical protein